MEKLDVLEEKIQTVTRLIQNLRDKNAKIHAQAENLRQENELLLSENRQVRKLMTEIDHLRDERKVIKNKCEKLILQYDKVNV